MLPKTLWTNPELLQQATSVFGLPCELDGKTGGCATWSDGPLHHIKIADQPDKGATLTVRGRGAKTVLSFMPLIVHQTPKLLTVQSDAVHTALAGLALAVAVDRGMIAEDYAIKENLFDQWTQAAETKAGSKRLLQVLLYALKPGNKSWEGFQRFLINQKVKRGL